MEREKISEKQQMILKYIREVTLKRGYPPAVREIGEAVNLKSPATVHAHLSTLEEKGYIRRDPAKSRAIEIIDEDFGSIQKEVSNIPVVGSVAAGEPLLAQQNITDYIPLPVDILPNDQTFILKVKGESMIGSGILDGDSLLVKQCSNASNGDLVVAMVEDGATVKYFYKEDGHFRLQPDNPDFEPIIVSEVTILGKVIGLFRLM